MNMELSFDNYDDDDEEEEEEEECPSPAITHLEFEI